MRTVTTDEVVAAHAEIVDLAKRLKPKKVLSKSAFARHWGSARIPRQRLDGTRPGRGRGSGGLPSPDPLVRRIEEGERSYVQRMEAARQALRALVAAEKALAEVSDETPFYADGIRQCDGYEREPHVTGDEIIDRLCKPCYNKRYYDEHKEVKVKTGPPTQAERERLGCVPRSKLS